MGFRSTATSTGVEGEGFGLFMVREIAKKHGGITKCTCEAEPESIYNVPYLDSYICYLSDKIKNNEQKKLLEDMRKESERLKNKNVYQRIYFDKPTYNFMFQPYEKNAELIKKQTYKITFSMEIAPRHKQEEVENNV